MSLLAVQGGATGTGTVTLLAPVTNTDRTLTLPDVTDTVAGIAATQTLTNKTLTSPILTTPALGTPSAINLTNATALPKAALPTGTVLQVVNATYSTYTGTSSTSYSDTGLTATITPTSATSKILVAFHQNGLTRDTTASTGMSLQLLRGASQISFVADSSLYANASYGIGQTLSTSLLDAPATTSATTYKTQFKVGNAFGGTVYCQLSGSTSTITLMEIAA